MPSMKRIHERLPSGQSMELLLQLRAAGESWDNIEDTLSTVPDELGELPWGKEVDRYIKRLILAASNAETAANYSLN